MERYVIHVTKKCNMECRYCYEQDKTSEYTWNEIKELLDNIIKYNKEFDIEFLGGEPTLAFHHIKDTVNYLELNSKIKIYSYGITTNGTILNDDIINFLKSNNKVHWDISMDGTPFMNSLRIMKNTKMNSHDIVMENFNKLKNEIDINRIGFHIITHPYNIAFLYNGIKHLYDNGARRIGIGTVESTIKIGKEYCKRYIYELDKISKSIYNNEFKNLKIDVLDYMKPRSDTRNYIKDKTGKIIAESYGRKQNDITKNNSNTGYLAYETKSKLNELIPDIREIVYLNHKKRMKNVN